MSPSYKNDICVNHTHILKNKGKTLILHIKLISKLCADKMSPSKKLILGSLKLIM